MRHRILVVEDEPAIAESVAYALERDGFDAVTAGSLAAAKERLGAASLVVLDLMLSDGSGFDFIGDVRREGNATPIIVLSSRDSEADRVAALETGADDYVTKPFSPREIVARVRAVLRRNPALTASEPPPGWKSPLRVDGETRRAHLGDRPLDLTRVEFDLLATLLAVPGRVFTRSELIDRVWGDGYAITDRTIDSHVKSLRRKVHEADGDPALIETVRGVGYRVSDVPPRADE
ncbi:MAG TPA: response regulator transcription factor [Polyangiaceae bacterium]|jgi:two-component system catabolic regulation response regulator CreB|nr:response regulator transcription factor [Polyangiaceae bacterium]